MYVDYDFYISSYGGKNLLDDFTKLEMQASTLVDYYTFNRITEPNDKVKFAVCELIDYLYELEDTGGKEVDSESVGGHSVSYVSGDNLSSTEKQKAIITKYLGHSGLMYRGRYHEDK